VHSEDLLTKMPRIAVRQSFFAVQSAASSGVV
jgi:hypothetical protein